MKTFLLSILLIWTIRPGTPTGLIGEWKLITVQTTSLTMTPQKIDYYLKIFENEIKYNLDVNNCFADSYSVDSNKIILFRVGCTQICCDGREDSLANYLNYSGSYKVHDSILTIINDKGTTFYLKRQ